MSVVVNHNYLARIAQNKAYKGYTSLAPIRHWQRKQRSSTCCGRGGQPGLPPREIFESVVKSNSFRQDLVALQRRLKVPLRVAIAGYTTQIA